MYAYAFFFHLTPAMSAASHHLSCLYDNGAQAGFASWGKSLSVLSGIAARNLLTLHHALGGMEETDKNEHVRTITTCTLMRFNIPEENHPPCGSIGVFFAAWLQTGARFA